MFRSQVEVQFRAFPGVPGTVCCGLATEEPWLRTRERLSPGNSGDREPRSIYGVSSRGEVTPRPFRRAAECSL